LPSQPKLPTAQATADRRRRPDQDRARLQEV